MIERATKSVATPTRRAAAMPKSSSTVSAKYQIVIPKALRLKFQVKPGQRLQLSSKNGKLIVEPAADVTQYIGVLKSTNEGPVAYQRRIRKDKRYI